jgi:UDP-N-acetylglucosamine diphosphorylase/glucosamine-1-phosphate N-acetyltransferase
MIDLYLQSSHAMQIVLFDTATVRNSLFPFSATRPVADIRIGMLTRREWWQMKLHAKADVLTEAYLQEFAPETQSTKLYVNAALIPSDKLLQFITGLEPGYGILYHNEPLALHTNDVLQFGFTAADCTNTHFTEWQEEAVLLSHPVEMIRLGSEALKEDFKLVTAGRISQPVSSTNHITGAEHIFIEEGTIAEHCFLNAAAGPVYIGRNCLVMEGAMIRGPFAMHEESVVKMGAKIYGTTSVGRNCTVGGEIKNSMFFDYSNKAHDGYLGDAVIGSWCNLGAGTSCSNIKNNAGEIKTWNPLLHKWIDAGRKCGIMMGDYSRTAINTLLNTGTVTGICANIVYNGFPPKYIKPFTWNIETGEKYITARAIRDIDNWKQLKHQRITEKEISIIEHLYQNQL